MRKYLNIVVDTMCFEGYKSIVELVTINMFTNINENCFKNNIINLGQEDKNNILNKFQIVINDCWNILDENIENNSYDYESTIEKLIRLSSASQIKIHFNELVKCYIKIFTDNSKEKLTVIINNIKDSKYKEKLKYQIIKYLNNDLINIIY